MKGKRFYGILLSLIIIGIQSFNLYRQQREERILEFEGYEISVIEERVDALYNKDKTDIATVISEEELEELDEMFLDLGKRELMEQNRDPITRMEVDFLMAREMHFIQKDVLALFEKEGIVAENISLRDIGTVQKEVDVYDIKPVYHERNAKRLEEARKQIMAIEEATKLVESLFDEEGNVRSDVTREDEETAFELIDEIKNRDVQ